eukprot:5010487-Prymnesium_polylepis.1
MVRIPLSSSSSPPSLAAGTSTLVCTISGLEDRPSRRHDTFSLPPFPCPGNWSPRAPSFHSDDTAQGHARPYWTAAAVPRRAAAP